MTKMHRIKGTTHNGESHFSLRLLLSASSHPYTLGLKEAMPSNKGDRDKKLSPILGSPPDLFHPPVGCGYFARCPYAMKVCEHQQPPEYLLAGDTTHQARCWLQHAGAPVNKRLYQTGANHAD